MTERRGVPRVHSSHVEPQMTDSQNINKMLEECLVTPLQL
jgi:hypothetical protein